MSFSARNSSLILWIASAISAFHASPQSAVSFGDVGPALPEAGSSALAGALDMAVQPSTGVFHASLPIESPAARGGLQPSVGIHYSSAAGIREAGIGWGLELPTIERRGAFGGPPTYANPEPQPANAYPYWQIAPETLGSRFTFNGEPLVPICEVGSPVACTAVDNGSLPAWALTGWFYFRLQSDSSFSRFFWSPDRGTWRVQLKGGDILEFGVPLVAPQPTDGNSLDDESYTHVDPSTHQSVTIAGHYRWNLVRAFTPAADGGQPRNVVLYQWTKLGKAGRGCLSDVYDTPPAVRTTDRPLLQDYAHHIHLSWKRPDQVRNSFAPIWRATPEFILTGVDVTSMPARRTSYGRQMVRRYHLDYRLNGQRSLLTSFQEEGRCPAVVMEGSNGLLPATTCPRRPPTTMRYSEPESNRIPSSILLTSSIPGKPIPAEDLHLIPIDVNGDSLPDLLESDPGNAAFNSPRKEDRHLYLYNGVWHEEHTLSNAHAAFSLWGYTVTGDFSANSRLGLLYALPTGPGADISMPGGFHSQVRLFKENAPGAWTLENESRPNWGLPWTYTQPDPFFVRLKLVGDVNGDGLLDLVNFGDPDYPGVGIGTTPHQPNSKRPDWDKNAEIAVGFSSRYIWGGPLENPNEAYHSELGFVTTLTCEGPSWSNMDGDWDDNAHVVQMADMDGDGLADIVAIGRSQIHYWPSTGRGDFTACTGPSCGCTTPTATALVNTFLPHDLGPDPAPTRIRLADVNGDGFADLISWDKTGLRVSFNVDGFRFEPPIFIQGTWFSSTWAKDVDDKAVEISFADMNRNGITDIVVAAHNQISALDLHRIVNIARAFAPDAWAPRPGLLIGIDNGLGLSHSIAYETTSELASIALYQKQPWAEPMPQTMQVVQRVTSRNGAPNAQPLRTYYDYADPAWDGWERHLRGFRKVTVTRGGDVPLNTTHTFYFPPAPNVFAAHWTLRSLVSMRQVGCLW